jgi:hypothetical protein
MNLEPPPDSSESYRRLDPAEIIRTARQLERRVNERFPDSGLGRVCGEIVRATCESESVAAALARPNYAMRGVVALCIVLLFAAIIGLFASLKKNLHPSFDNISDLLQGLEAGVNDLVFIGFAIWFLTRLEARWKRRRALRSLHGLRSLAHIVDMHQLTKDPDRITGRGVPDTESSPKRMMTPFELTRYLDYCSEALALLSKAAALHVQQFDDGETMSAVGEIEDLTDGLSRKIWQKITILDRVMNPDEPGRKTP